MPTLARGLAGIAVGILILVLLLRRVALSRVVESFANVNLETLSLGVIFIVLSYIFRSATWRTLLRPLGDYPYGPVFRSTMIGYLVNNILPARLGDVTRGVWFSRRQSATPTFVFGSLGVERLLDFLAILVLLVVAAAGLHVSERWLIATGLALLALVLACFAAAAVARTSEFDYSVLTGRFPWLNKVLKDGLVQRVGSVLRETARAVTLGTAIRGVPWAIATWAVTFCGLYFVLASLGSSQHFGLLPTALVLATSSIGLAIPSLPASLGAYQAAFVFGAILTGISEPDALAGSFLYQAVWIVVTSLLGVGALIWEGVSIGFVIGLASDRTTISR